MKLKHLYYILFGGMALTVAACKKNNLWVDKDPKQPGEKARFVLHPDIPTTGALYSYYILEDPAPGSPFKIPVGVTNVSDHDRVVKFEYASSTAVAGTQYNAPTEITIPAGKALDTLTVQGLFNGYPTGRVDTLKVKIAAANNSVGSVGFQDAITLVLQKYCNVLLDELDGDFDNTRETTSSGGSPYGPYTSTVALSPIAGSTTSANVVFGDFWDSGFDATGTIDWADPAKFTVNIPRQATGLEYDTDQPMDVRTSPGQISTFSSCDQSYSLTVDFIINNYPTPGSAAYYVQNYKIYIKR